MRRVYLLVTLMCLSVAWSLNVAAEGPLPAPVAPLRLTQAAGDDLAPQLAVGADGRALVVWKHTTAEHDSAAIELAQAPLWQRATLAPLPVELAAGIQLRLPAQGERTQLLWSSPVSTTRRLAWDAPTADAPIVTTTLSSLATPPTALSLLDGDGRIHSAWLQDNALHYLVEPEISATLPLTLSVVDGSLAFALDASASPHFALLGRTAEGDLQLVYVSALADTVLVRAAADLGDLRLLLGPTGEAHLLWREGAALNYASSRDWTTGYRLLDTAPPPDQWAAACGPNGTLHLAWLAEGALWYGVGAAAGTSCVGSQVYALPTLAGLQLAIDRWDQRHLAWAAPDELGDWQVYYLPPTPREAQLAVAYPLAGETLLADARVQVLANVPPGDLLRVECYLQATNAPDDEAPGAAQADLLYLGADEDGYDGWTAPLTLGSLAADSRYRVVALGLDRQGRMTRALGGWFSVQRPGAAWAEPDGVYRGQAALPIGVDGTLTTSLPLVIMLAPVQPGPSGAALEGEPHLLLASAPVSPSTSLTVPFDSRLLPDGSYAVRVDSAETDAPPAMASSALLRVANALFPEVRVTAPRSNVVFSENIDVAADASDLDGAVRRVDFYLERIRPLLEAPATGDVLLAMPELIWLGSDGDGSNGWRVRAPVTARYDGDDWVVRAVAYDDQDLSTSARSTGSLTVLGWPRPVLRLLAPQPHQTVSGIYTVTLLATQQPLDEAALYLEEPGGTCIPLGLLTPDKSQWVQQWDTTRVSNGIYTLIVIGSRNGVPVALERCVDLRVANGSLAWAAAEKMAAQPLSGHVNVQVRYRTPEQPAGALRLYSRDLDGRLRLIGEGAPEEGGWCVLWDTWALLDGPYDLVATLSADTTTSLGAVELLELRVQVRNHNLSITLDDPGVRRAWRGALPISWQVLGGYASQVDIAYSPDGGAHWLPVAEGLSAQVPYEWDTTRFPDSAQAVLRLTVHAGDEHAVVYSAPFNVDNVNEAPHVALLAPRAGSAYGEQISVVWEARDPDRDSLIIDLDYRRAGASWTTLAHGQANTGIYLWTLTGLTPALDYEVRVRARDLSGAFGEDLVQALRVTTNKPPSVELLWPNRDTQLSDEAVVLWTARDPQDERLAIDLYYSDNAGQTWLPLAEGLENLGYYVWQISSLPPGEVYRVRVVARSALFAASDESEQVFSIGASTWEDAALLSPTPDSTVTGLHIVRWSLASPSNGAYSGAGATSGPVVSLLVRRVGTTPWQTLTADLAHAGLYLWNTRTFPDGVYEVRLGVGPEWPSGATRYTQPRRVTVQNGRNHTPRVAWVTPQGGECWAGVHTLSWEAWDEDGDPLTATLWLSLDAGRAWSRLATLDARAGGYLWDTRQAPAGKTALLRITVTDGLSTARDTTPGVVYLTNVAGQPPRAAFTSPSTPGILDNDTVSWTAQDADGDALKVGLSISIDGGQAWQALARGLPARGEYTLEAVSLGVGSGAVPGGRYRLRLSVDDGRYRIQVDSSEFSWTASEAARPTLVLTAPRGGETWAGAQEVRWELPSATVAQGLSIAVEYSRDNGRTWLSKVRGLENTSSYRWDTRDLVNGIYRLRVTVSATDVAAPEGIVARATSSPFSVSNAGRNAPVVSLLQPREGEALSGPREVRWRAWDPDGDALRIGLAYSVDEGVIWQPLATQLPNTGSYVWDTTTVPNCARVWLRISASDGRETVEDVGDDALAVLNPYAPVVTLLAPTGGGLASGNQQVRWAAAQETNSWLRASLALSLNGGVTWQNLASGLASTGSYVWDTTALPENSAVLLRVSVTDGLRSALSMTREPVIVRGNTAR